MTDEELYEDFVERIYPVYKPVEGWLPHAQALALYALARDVPEGGTIVEIGTFLGKSAIVLGLGAHESVTVLCVDPFNAAGGPQYDQYKTRNLRAEWARNIAAAGLHHKVFPFQGYSHDAAQVWRSAMDLLYIDGDHHYDPVRQDILDWAPFLKPNGILAMDDANEPEVRKAIDLYVKSPMAPLKWANWTTIEGRLFVATKGSE